MSDCARLFVSAKLCYIGADVTKTLKNAERIALHADAVGDVYTATIAKTISTDAGSPSIVLAPSPGLRLKVRLSPPPWRVAIACADADIPAGPVDPGPTNRDAYDRRLDVDH